MDTVLTATAQIFSVFCHVNPSWTTDLDPHLLSFSQVAAARFYPHPVHYYYELLNKYGSSFTTTLVLTKHASMSTTTGILWRRAGRVESPAADNNV